MVPGRDDDDDAAAADDDALLLSTAAAAAAAASAAEPEAAAAAAADEAVAMWVATASQDIGKLLAETTTTTTTTTTPMDDDDDGSGGGAGGSVGVGTAATSPTSEGGATPMPPPVLRAPRGRGRPRRRAGRAGSGSRGGRGAPGVARKRSAVAAGLAARPPKRGAEDDNHEPLTVFEPSPCPRVAEIYRSCLGGRHAFGKYGWRLFGLMDAGVTTAVQRVTVVTLGVAKKPTDFRKTGKYSVCVCSCVCVCNALCVCVVASAADPKHHGVNAELLCHSRLVSDLNYRALTTIERKLVAARQALRGMLGEKDGVVGGGVLDVVGVGTSGVGTAEQRGARGTRRGRVGRVGRGGAGGGRVGAGGRDGAVAETESDWEMDSVASGGERGGSGDGWRAGRRGVGRQRRSRR